jgi:pyruvate-formate lyase-activating enzyme
VLDAAEATDDDLTPERLARFEGALRAIEGWTSAYLDLNEMTAIGPGYVRPEDLLHKVAATAFPALDGWAGDEVAAVLLWAENRKRVSRLALAIGIVDALARGNDADARRRADRLLPLWHNNLHVQALHRRAHGKTAPDLGERFCRAPFEALETAPDGNVYFCCPAWLPVPIGRLDNASADRIWNSPTAQEIRRSIHDGDYSYCSRMHCPHLSTHSLPEKKAVTHKGHQAIMAAKSTALPEGPKKVVLSHDRSCNLLCPSCRTSLILARKEEQKRLNEFAETVILPLARNAERVRLTGSGDPFGSSHFRYVIKRLDRESFPRLRLDLQTNGVLFDEAAWRELDLDGRLDKVMVSIDAATEATYDIVRRGGSFGRLLDNLAFLKDKRADGEIKVFRLDFVVQALNFREMPAIMELAHRYGFDGVKFQMIRNWDTYSPTEFQRHNIGAPKHPEYTDLLAVLADRAFKSGGVEFWGMAGPMQDARALSDHATS